MNRAFEILESIKDSLCKCILLMILRQLFKQDNRLTDWVREGQMTPSTQDLYELGGPNGLLSKLKSSESVSCLK